MMVLEMDAQMAAEVPLFTSVWVAAFLRSCASSSDLPA